MNVNGGGNEWRRVHALLDFDSRLNAWDGVRVVPVGKERAVVGSTENAGASMG